MPKTKKEKEKTVRVKAEVRLDSYHLITLAVDEGIQYGWNRAYKHTDKPEEESIKDEIHQAIMNSLCEIMQFSEDEWRRE